MIKNNFRILKKQYAYLQTILKVPVKFEKDWPKTVGGVAGRRMVGALTDGRTYGWTYRLTDGWADTQNFRGYNIKPRHFLVVGHKNGLGSMNEMGCEVCNCCKLWRKETVIFSIINIFSFLFPLSLLFFW